MANKRKQGGLGRYKFEDFGFGNKINTQGSRLVLKNGDYNIERRGGRNWHPYQTLVESSWISFLTLVCLLFIGINLVFAIPIYILGIECIGLESQGFLRDFYRTIKGPYGLL